MDRRRFLQQGGMAGLAAWADVARSLAATKPRDAALHQPMLDAHIHLFDPTRAGGIPWPLPDDSIYKSTLPARYEKLAAPLDIVGAIAIEASPLATDNDWLLRTVHSSTFMVGMIGDLPPTSSNFSVELERLHRDPLFLGIRHGNLWNRSLSDDLRNPALRPALKELEQAELVLEAANPDLPLLKALSQVSDSVPKLTIVIDHLPHMELPPAEHDRQELARCLADLAANPRVNIKLSEIPRAGDSPASDIVPYRERLDRLDTLFGDDRVIFGSDWPNSDHIAPLDQTVALVKNYMSSKSSAQRRKLYSENSRRVYRWKPRRPTQSTS
jgi:L-fuconolactonase